LFFVSANINKDHEKALEEANEMIRCDPEHPKGFVRKGGAHYFLGDFDGALEEYKRAQEHMHNGKADAKLLSNFPQYVSTVQSKKQ
jgi:tetratricopeptide (TPR) repeat protein